MRKYKLTQLMLLLTATLFIQQLEAQKGYAWKKLGGGINNGAGCGSSSQIQAYKYIDGNLYVSEFTQLSGTVTIHKWNGTNWSKFPTFGVTGAYYYITDIEEYNGELYLCGDIATLNGTRRAGNKNYNLIKFNGTNWDSIPSYYNGNKDSTSSYKKMKAYKNKLYYIINDYQNNFRNEYLLSFDGSTNSTSLIKTVRETNTKIYNFSSIEVIKNKLIVAGNFDSIGGGVKTSSMFYYDGSNFTYTKNKNTRDVFKLAVKNDSQFLVVNANNNSVELWQDDSLLKDVSNPTIQFYYYNGFTFYKNLILAATNTVGNYYYDLDSSKWFQNQSMNQMFNLFPVYTKKEKAIVVSCGNGFDGAAELALGAVVSGKIYVDKDSSCTYNTGDLIIKHTLIEFDNGTQKFYTYSDNNGNYELSVLAGSYNVSYSMPDVQSNVAPCSAISITIIAGTTTTNLGIPIHPSTNKNLGVTISAYRGYRTRLGFTEKYTLTGTNYSIINDSLVMKLQYPSTVTYVSSDIAPFSNTSNELVYKFANLTWLEKKTITIEFKTTVGVSSLGDKLGFFASIVNRKNDSVPENNDDTLVQTVVGAYDPNIKQCYPEGKVKPGLKKIKYTIHFQNTGNDTAYKVTVVDTFTQKLGLRSLKVTNTSHPSSYSLRLGDNNTLIWEFNNILLPDSHINEKASHGFISFEANVNGSIALGDSITNKAYIYFDYQTPIKTNVASVVIFNENTSVQETILQHNEFIKVYPNPSSSSINVKVNNQYQNKMIYIYNSLGQQVKFVNLNANGESNIHVADLDSGIYFIKIEGTEISAKFMVQ